MSDISINDESVRIHTLSNGVRVALHNIGGANEVNVALLVGAGAQDEIVMPMPSSSLRGAAHWIEHMCLYGSAQRPDGNSEVHKSPGNFYGSTRRKFTEYSAALSSKKAFESFPEISCSVCHPLFEETEVEDQRPVIHSEWLEQELDPRVRQELFTTRTAFGDHPSMHPVIGTEEGILSMSAQDLRAFHKANYVGARTVVAIEGNMDFDEEAIVALLENELTLPRGRRADGGLPPYTGGFCEFAEQSRGVRVKLALCAKGQIDFDKLADCAFLSDMLGVGRGSILMRSLRYERGLVYDVGCRNDAEEELLVLSFITFADSVGTCLSVIADEIKGLASHVAPDGLARCQQVTCSKSTKEVMPLGALEIANEIFEYGCVPSRDILMRKYSEVTAERVQAVAEDLLKYPPTLVVSGNTRYVPAFEDVCEAFSAGSRSSRSKLLAPMVS